MRHLRYGWYVLRHKWFVFLASIELGVPMLGVLHDLSKFRPSEWVAYTDHFYGPGRTIGHGRDAAGYYKPTDTGDPAFDFAFFLHQKRNRHHWQWHVLPDAGGAVVWEIPERYRREMLADWWGAGRAQSGKQHRGWAQAQEWYQANSHKMQLHPDTRGWIEMQLALRARSVTSAGPAPQNGDI